MSDNNEWKDITPSPSDLSYRGRVIITCIAGGLVIGLLGFLGLRIRPLGLGVGTFGFISGIGILLRRRKTMFKPGLVITVAGFLLLLANPRFGLVAGFAGYFLIAGSIGLVVAGIAKAVKLSWDMINR